MKLLPVAYPPAFFVQLLVHPQQMCLVATYDSSVVAFSSATMAMDTHNWTSGPLGSCGSQDCNVGALQVTLLTLGVSLEFRRRGIARKLVHEVVQRLRSSCRAPCASLRDPTPAVILCAEVARNNTSGQSFYSHLGMHRQATVDEQRRFGSKAQTCMVLGVMSTIPVS
jgi:ribosomal protein S18 acetylase RimI-like enzyme